MKGNINKILDKIYHDMAISELQRAYTKNETKDLSYHDVLYLNIIEAHPNEYTSSQIADLLGITRPSVTQKINELFKKGYVIRTQSEKDKRVFYLSINENAAAFFEEASRDVIEGEKMLLQKYGEEKLQLFCQMLEDFANFSV